MRGLFWKVFNIVAGLASIIGVLYLLFTDKEKGVIALAAFCLFLIFLSVVLIVGMLKLIKKEYPDDYRKIAAFTSYETTDGTHGVYEVFKVIQSKRIFLQQVDHNFKWSGTKQPDLSSDLQEIKQVIKNDANNFDKAILLLKKPLGFNETGTLHFKAITDDFDGKALPYLYYKVREPINVILFRVTLKYKSDETKPAKLLKKPINSNISTDFEQCKSVAFDKLSKSYYYYLINPEIGYYYRLEWEK